jgi:hypothetical protein
LVFERTELLDLVVEAVTQLMPRAGCNGRRPLQSNGDKCFENVSNIRIRTPGVEQDEGLE